MKSVSSVIRICISAGVALAALAPHTGQAASQICPGAGMAMFEQEGGISAVETGGSWLRAPSDSETLVTMATVEGLPPCTDPEFRVSPDGQQLITWPYDDEILSVTSSGTAVTKLPEGDKLWAADVTFISNGLAVIAALLYRDMEEPRLTLIMDTREGAGELMPPYEVTGADCGSGVTAVGTTAAGEVMVLCEGSFTVFDGSNGGFSLATFPLDLADRQLIVAAPSLERANRVTFFAIVKDLTDMIDPVYQLVRIRVSPEGNHGVLLMLDDVAYAGGAHGLAVMNDRNLVYMDEEGMVQVVGSSYDEWSAGVIHPLRPEAKLSAADEPLRVLISEYDVELLTLTDAGWESTTLFDVGMPPASPPEKEDSGGCSVAGADPATGLGQALLLMLALALVTTPRLARRRGAAHDGASCPSRSSLPSGRSW